MKLTEITSFLEKIAPLSLQEEYDNSGLIIGSHNLLVDAALITIDCTELVVDEAIKRNLNPILAGRSKSIQALAVEKGLEYGIFDLSSIDDIALKLFGDDGLASLSSSQIYQNII